MEGEITIAPFCRCLGPNHFQSASDGIVGVTGAKGISPAKAQLLERRAFRRRADDYKMQR